MPPCLSHLINSLLQNVFDLLIGYFCLTAGLRMVGSFNVMCGPKFLEEVPEGGINEMRPSITYYHPRCAKPWKDNLMKYLADMLSICCPARHGFYPLGDVMHDDQDILIIMGLWKRSHIVDDPHIE